MIYAVLLAAGHSRRFGSDKLMHEVAGRPMVRWAMEALPAGMPGVIVTRSERVAALAAEYPALQVVSCPPEGDDVALSIRLGLSALPEDAEGAMFLVCDQPWLSRRSVARLALCFSRQPEKIWMLCHAERQGNPCVFPRSLFPELMALPPRQGGKHVLRRHESLCARCSCLEPWELEDMDEYQ